MSVLIAGQDVKSLSEQVSKIDGVSKVMLYDKSGFDHRTAENISNLAHEIQKSQSYSHILLSATNEGKNIMPRIAALVNGAAISDVIKVNSENEFVRPTYAGNAISTVEATHSPKVLTVRATAFEKSEIKESAAPIEEVQVSVEAFPGTEFVEEKIVKSDRPEITAANVVIAGGRALKSADNFEILYKFADTFPQGAAVGASRAAVDAGYAANDLQIGQTGKVCAPDLYFAVGVSGAIQHLAGMKDSKCIVAINTDEEAPIFQVADYGVKADLFEAIPQLTDKMK